MTLKRADYWYGVRWIAENDEPTETDALAVAYQISSLLLADLFGVAPEQVGAHVVRIRTAVLAADAAEAAQCDDPKEA